MREAEIPLLDADPSQYATDGVEDRNGSAWRTALIVVAVTHLAFIALAWAGSYFFASGEGIPSEGVADIWRRWDTEHYIDIAEFGYDSPETHQYGEAFFPLYPLAIRAFTTIGLNPVFAGMLISAAASVVALAYLYKLAEEDLFPGAGRRAVLLFALFPTAVFLTAAYSEALFLAGAIPAFYYARRGRWSLVGLPAAIAMGTRIAGAFVLLGVAVEFIRQRDFDRKKVLLAAGAGAIALLPLLGYMAYLWAANDDPFYFFTAQSEGWDRVLTDPRDAFGATWRTFYDDYPPNWLIAWRVEIAAAIAGLFFTGWAFARREYGYGVYMGTLMIPLLVSRWYLSIPRMLLSMFPIALLLASVTRNHRRYELVLATFAVFAALGVLVFTSGRWFF
jgi:hypothetical protein